VPFGEFVRWRRLLLSGQNSGSSRQWPHDKAYRFAHALRYCVIIAGGTCHSLMPEAIQATAGTERIPSLDFLRGIAVLGILFINIESFAYPEPWSPWKFGYASPIDHDTRFWVYCLTQGKFYTMFALLFGVGFYLFLERLEQKQLGLRAMDVYARRLLWLFVIGIVHAYFIWSGDVLYHYAICGLLLFPFRSFKTSALLVVLAVLVCLQLSRSYEQTQRRQGWQADYMAAMQISESARDAAARKAIQRWENLSRKREPDTSTVVVQKRTYRIGLQESYAQGSAHKGMLYYQGLLFPSLMVMILGMLLYRAGSLTAGPAHQLPTLCPLDLCL